MNRLQAEMKKGIFSEAEKAWDKNKGKLGLKSGDKEEKKETPAAPSASAQPAAPAAAAPAAPVAPAPAAPAPAAPAAAAPTPTAPAPAEPAAAPSAPEKPADAVQPNEQPAPSEEQPVVKKKLTTKLKEKFMSKLNDPKVQDKAEQALKKEAKKKFFGFRF